MAARLLVTTWTGPNYNIILIYVEYGVIVQVWMTQEFNIPFTFRPRLYSAIYDLNESNAVLIAA